MLQIETFMPHRAYETWLVNPLNRFMNKSSSSGILLFFMAFLSLLIANSPLHDSFESFWNTKIYLSIGDFKISNTILHWVDDGLMSIFFFVIGLELKREVMAGELAEPKDALMAIVAAIGGMLLPAAIFFAFNQNASADAMNGWGIPMATDIAFALGVIYLLGDKVPTTLKIFLTALAIIDDVGAVSIIAFFYTDSISTFSLLLGGFFFSVMLISNKLGIRSTFYYSIIGIGGVWLAFLMSGVHATIAAVLAAFTIPATVKIDKQIYLDRIKNFGKRLERAECSDHDCIVSKNEEMYLNQINRATEEVISPLQRLEHSMHPLVAFVVMPIFALANAGVRIEDNFLEMITGSVALGVGAGLLIGKVVGIVSFVYLFKFLGLYKIPKSLNFQMILGVSFLAAIGFTMSLFITSLAFEDPAYATQAKLGVLSASILAGVIGFVILNKSIKEKRVRKKRTTPPSS